MKVAVIIPAYKVKQFIVPLLNKIDDSISRIFLVDDFCPENSGDYAASNYNDPRLTVIKHEKNRGVGGAVISGYKAFLKDESLDIAVKLDGDGQMNPDLINELVSIIGSNKADYSKGNRFFDLSTIKSMPALRLFGNSMLSLTNKFVNGYWHIMDPTNGFTAIHKSALKKIDLEKIDHRYFFESDMLFRLGISRVAVADFPMTAVYGEEKSNLNISRIIFEFPPKYLNRFLKRIFYAYFIRDFNAGSIQLFFGLVLILFGTIFGAFKWYNSIATNDAATVGTVMLAALPVIIGSQLLLGFLNFDVQNTPKAS